MLHSICHFLYYLFLFFFFPYSILSLSFVFCLPNSGFLFPNYTLNAVRSTLVSLSVIILSSLITYYLLLFLYEMRIYSNSWIPAFAGMTEGRLALRFTLFKSGNQLTNLKRDTHLLSFFHLLPAPKRSTLYAPR